MIRVCWLLLLTLPGCPALAADWQQISLEHDPVQVWSAQLEQQPYTTVRAETHVAAPIFQLLGILQDPASQTQWLPYTHKVEVLATPSPTRTLVRFESVARWPFRAREAVTLFEVSQPTPNQIHIAMINQPDAEQHLSKMERIQSASGYWELTALGDCQTQVRYESGSDWGGAIPQWLVNRLNRTLAVQALQNLQQWAPAQTRYNQKPIHLQTVPRHAACP